MTCVDPLLLPRSVQKDFSATTKVKKKRFDCKSSNKHKKLTTDDKAKALALASNVLDPADFKEGLLHGAFLTTKDACPMTTDSRASVSIAPLRSDFIGPIKKINSTVQGINSKVRMLGVGAVRWKMRTCAGHTEIIKTLACCVPSAEARLLSPQTHLQQHKDVPKEEEPYCKMTPHGTTFKPCGGDPMEVPYDPSDNLPMCIDEVKQSSSCVEDSNSITASDICLSVADETNQNIARAQKELLGLHWKWGHVNLRWTQSLTKPRHPRRACHHDDTKTLQPVC